MTGSGTAATSNAWVSSDVGVATVSSIGVVTGVSAGSVNITYTNNNGCQKVVAMTVNAGTDDQWKFVYDYWWYDDVIGQWHTCDYGSMDEQFTECSYGK